jgi:hypothetical protein
MDIDECVELANYADECGLDGVMIISPWYFRLTDEGIYTFYSQIARRTAAKIFIYNFPSAPAIPSRRRSVYDSPASSQTLSVLKTPFRTPITRRR